MFGHKLARAILTSTALAGGCLAAPSLAQTGPLPPVPDELIADDQGFDLLSTSYQKQAESLTIGDSDTGLTFQRTWTNGAWVHNYNFELTVSPPVSNPEWRNYGSIQGIIGKNRINFYWDGATYQDSSGSGKTVSPAGTGYIVTLKDGTKIVFDRDVTCGCDAGSTTHSFIASAIVKPSGERVSLYYKVDPGTAPLYWDMGHRISGAVSSNGYELKFEYVSDTPTWSISGDTDYNRIKSVTGYNLATNYCDPQADHCSAPPTNLPRLSYAYSSPPAQYGDPWYVNVSDAMGRTTTYTLNQYFVSPSYYNRIIGIRRPGDSSNSTSVIYGDSNNPDRVTSITNDGVTYNYNTTDTYTGADQGFLIVSGRTIVRTNPTGASVTYKAANFVANSGRITSVIDPLSHQTDYGYDVAGRLTSIHNPEGDTKTYAYDGRGNLLSVTEAAKLGSGLANIVSSATYPSSCTNALTCNEPLTVVDAKGNTTTFTYDATHGGVLTATLPAASTGGVNPQTRYGYTALQASYKNSVGTIVASGFPTYKRTSISNCQTLSSCTGTADETRTTLAYAGNGITNNLTLTSRTDAAGDGSLSATTAFTYDDAGNVASIDGPLVGSNDTVIYRYNTDRERVGAISPDPDGAGALKRRAIRTIYNNNGQPTLIEAGTVNGTTDADWSAFTSLQQQTTTYDVNARKAADSISGGGTTYALTQYSYDTDGRLDCTAVRMKPSTYTSLPASACTATTGIGDADRITKMTYDNADRVTKTTSAYGTADASDDATMTYTNNGKLATATDANGNKTSYTYDGFDRPWKTNYPSPTKGSGTSSTTDFEQLTYDANGNVTNKRARDGIPIAFGVDNLNRVTSRTENGSLTRQYGYNLFGQLTSSSWPSGGSPETLTYDALGRLTSRAEPYTTLYYQYDAAGRRTRVTWPDGLYINYNYDLANEMTTVVENGTTTLATYGYDDLGRRTSLTRGNGTASYYSYDGASRLTCLRLDLAGGGTLDCNPTASGQDNAITFRYNAAGQIVSRVGANTAYAWTGSVNVNRAYTANGLNQYSASGSVPLTYDTRGNLYSSGSSTYGYDAVNHLTVSNSAASAFEYGSLDELQGYTLSTGYVRFASDGGNIIGEYLFGASPSLQRRYVYGADTDEPLVWYEGTGTSDKRWLIPDERGSVVAVTNASGASTATNTYDEYGIPGANNLGRFQYTGQAWLSEIGLYYYKARMYSPTLGRFMQTDPIGYNDGMNWYNYVGGDPVNSADPSGTDQNYLDVNPGAAASNDGPAPDIVVTALRAIGVKTTTFTSLLTPATVASPGVVVSTLPNIVITGTRTKSDSSRDDGDPEDIIVTGHMEKPDHNPLPSGRFPFLHFFSDIFENYMDNKEEEAKKTLKRCYNGLGSVKPGEVAKQAAVGGAKGVAKRAARDATLTAVTGGEAAPAAGGDIIKAGVRGAVGGAVKSTVGQACK